jgi:5-hydroxyisourate hydrolase
MATTPSPITCHVLDTTIGRPGASIKATLTCLSPPTKQFGSIPHTFTATTDSDGRIKEWDNKYGIEVWGIINDPNLTDRPLVPEGEGKEGQAEGEVDESTMWKLGFDVEGYYGRGKTFFPVVEVTFRVRPGEKYHVPVLLGPWSYTTYRGS